METEEGTIRVAGPAGPDAAGRLDKWLAEALPPLSRERIKSLIRGGKVDVNGETVSDGSAKIKPGDRATVRIPRPALAIPRGEAIPLSIVYEDDDVIVIDKPAGLVVHPAAGNPDGTLVNALIAHCGDSLSGIGGVRRPGIVHRLDKDTSGLLVAAKNDAAHQALVAGFAEREIRRVYQALVWGVPSPRAGTLSGNIGRSPQNRKKMAVVQGGRPAQTSYRVLQSWGPTVALVECRLGTGRTHQIRVHMANAGHAVVGDATYSRTAATRLRALPADAGALISGLSRQLLHAAVLEFRHPRTGRDQRFESALPVEMAAILATLGAAA